MAEFIYYEKSKTTQRKAKRSRKSFAPVRRAKVEDSIENEMELPFQHKGGSPAPTEDEVEEKIETQPAPHKTAPAKEEEEEDTARPAPTLAPSSTSSTAKPVAAPPASNKTKTRVVKKPASLSEPSFVRDKERFFAHFRTMVEGLLASHAPLDKSGRAREVNAKVHEICGEFLADVETTPVPTKKIPEEEYQRHLREDQARAAEIRARSVRCAKLRQRIDLLRKEIEKQTKEQEQWDDLRKEYSEKSEQIKRARGRAAEQLETTAKRLKTGEIDYPDFLSEEDKALLQQCRFKPMDVEKATQTLTLQLDYLNGTLREMKHFDAVADHWVKNALATYHKQWQQESVGSAPNPRALIRDITKADDAT